MKKLLGCKEDLQLFCQQVLYAPIFHLFFCRGMILGGFL
jgi:hypothetical protein